VHCLFCTFSSVTGWVCPSVFRIHSYKRNSTCWALPCMPYIQLLTYRCTDASFTGVLKNFRTSAKNSEHGVNFRTTFEISGQRPGLHTWHKHCGSDSHGDHCIRTSLPMSGRYAFEATKFGTIIHQWKAWLVFNGTFSTNRLYHVMSNQEINPITTV